MEIIDNIHKTLTEDLVVELREGSKLSIAASSFSIYAFQELKEPVKDIEELRFVLPLPPLPPKRQASRSVNSTFRVSIVNAIFTAPSLK